MTDKKQSARPFTLRLTQEERTRLEGRAGNRPLGAYMRARLLEEDEAPRKMRGAHIVKDRQELGRVLGLLGESGLADSLSTLARAAENGALPVAPETENALQRACKTIDDMGVSLMKALGLRKTNSSTKLSNKFGEVN